MYLEFTIFQTLTVEELCNKTCSYSHSGIRSIERALNRSKLDVKVTIVTRSLYELTVTQLVRESIEFLPRCPMATVNKQGFKSNCHNSY